MSPKKISSLILSAVLQVGSVAIIAYATTWYVGVLLICLLWGHNLEKH